MKKFHLWFIVVAWIIHLASKSVFSAIVLLIAGIYGIIKAIEEYRHAEE